MWIAPAMQSLFPVDLQSQTLFPASVNTNRTYPHYSTSLIMRRKATDWASEAFAVTQPFRGPRCRMLWSERLGWGQLIAVSQMNSCIETRGGPRAPKPSWHQRAACAEQGRAGRSSASAWREPRPRPRPRRRWRGVPHKLLSSANEGIHFTGNYTGVTIHIGALRRPRGAQPRFPRRTEPLGGYVSPPVCERQGCKLSSTLPHPSCRPSVHPHVARHLAPLCWHRHTNSK